MLSLSLPPLLGLAAHTWGEARGSQAWESAPNEKENGECRKDRYTAQSCIHCLFIDNKDFDNPLRPIRPVLMCAPDVSV